ncbi:unnamed protein product [Camellia sinensis]
MGVDMAPAQSNKLRWGEMEEDEGEDLEFLLPRRQEIGPDENGVKKVVEYKFNDEGNKVKITTTTRIRKLASARLSKRAVERRSWPKFGDAVHEDVGSRLTMVSTEEIILERPRAPERVMYLRNGVLGVLEVSTNVNINDEQVDCTQISNGSKSEETKVAGDPLAQIGKVGAVLMVCRTCGKKGDHWTSRCPYKDLAQPSEGFIDKPPASEVPTVTSGPSKGSYVPPGMRPGAERTGTDMRRRNEENSVRVTNLSEDTREADLHELFRTFGSVSRVYVAVDQKTGMSRGFGFVNFVNKEDAEKAINKLNGYGYDNLILRVEWAAPRASYEKHKNEDIQGSLFEEPSHGALFCTWETFKRTLKELNNISFIVETFTTGSRLEITLARSGSSSPVSHGYNRRICLSQIQNSAKAYLVSVSDLDIQNGRLCFYFYPFHYYEVGWMTNQYCFLRIQAAPYPFSASHILIQPKNNSPEAQEKCITRLLLFMGMRSSLPLPSWKVISIQILFYFILEDFVFYWGHRILHTKWLYKHVHSVHHEYATPFGLTSEYAHPAEILFLGFATIIGPVITGPHLITLWLWMVVRVLETVEAHCGYHFPWSLSNFLPLYGGADFHDYHHRLLYTKSGNYSSTFIYMDWIFGTDKGYRRLKALKSS